MMEANNMTTPERPRRDIFGISAPPRERSTLVITKPDSGPAPVFPEPEKSPEASEKHWRERLAGALKNRLVRMGLVTGVIGLGGSIAIDYAYQNIPAIHESINKLSGQDLSSIVPSAFDNSKYEGVMGPKNITRIPLSSLPETLSQKLGINKQNNTLTMVIPLDIPIDTSINYKKGLSERLSTQELQNEAQKQGVRNYIEWPVTSPGTTIKAPIFMGKPPTEYRILLVKGDPKIGENPSRASYARVFAYYSDLDITLVGWFTGLRKDNGFVALLPMQENTNWSEENWRKLPEIELNTPIMRTVQQGPLRLEVKAYRGKKVGGIAEIVDKTAFLLNLNLLTITDGAVNEKLVLTEEN